MIPIHTHSDSSIFSRRMQVYFLVPPFSLPLVWMSVIQLQMLAVAEVVSCFGSVDSGSKNDWILPSVQ
jgi:hypothetical protein